MTAGWISVQSVALGWLYHHGEGVPEDAETAAAWYRKAADRGDARAQFNLGVMCTLREGVPRTS